jgi:hypothetical protein
VMKNLKKRASNYEDRFPKTLFVLSWCRIAQDNSFEDPLSRSQMHIDECDEVDLAAQQWRRQKPRCIGGLWFFIVFHSVAVARIYMEDPSRVTTSCNRLALSLSKRIRHGLIANINGKRKSRPCKTLG